MADEIAKVATLSILVVQLTACGSDKCEPGEMVGGCGLDGEIVQCLDSGDCCGATHCDALGKCVKNCASDSECSAGQACLAEYGCVAKCESDADCELTETCSEGTCRQMRCSRGGECPEGSLELAGTLIRPRHGLEAWAVSKTSPAKIAGQEALLGSPRSSKLEPSVQIEGFQAVVDGPRRLFGKARGLRHLLVLLAHHVVGGGVEVPPFAGDGDEAGGDHDLAQQQAVGPLLGAELALAVHAELVARLGGAAEVVEGGAHVERGAVLLGQGQIHGAAVVVDGAGAAVGVGHVALLRRAAHHLPHAPLHADRAHAVVDPQPQLGAHAAQRGRGLGQHGHRRGLQQAALQVAVGVGAHEVVGRGVLELHLQPGDALGGVGQPGHGVGRRGLAGGQGQAGRQQQIEDQGHGGSFFSPRPRAAGRSVPGRKPRSNAARLQRPRPRGPPGQRPSWDPGIRFQDRPIEIVDKSETTYPVRRLTFLP